MPTKTDKPKADQLYVALYAFAGQDLSVAEGARYQGDHELVQRFSDRFVPESTPDDELRRLRAAAAAPPPAPEPIGRVKLRVLPGAGGSPLDGGRNQEVLQGGRLFSSGDVLEAEGKDAQHLLDIGACEVVKHLPAKKETDL